MAQQGNFSLAVQRTIALAVHIPLALITKTILLGLMGYRFGDTTALRQTFAALYRTGRPVLICANHLTLIDSMLLHVALADILWYQLHFRYFAWNLPAIETVQKSMVRRILAYTGKCIPVWRSGTPEQTKILLERVHTFLGRGEAVMIFPEGTRSRSGQIDLAQVMYGTGQIIAESPESHVLCIYLRAYGGSFGEYPVKNSRFFMRFAVVPVTYTGKDRRSVRNYSLQVMQTLKNFENEYFSHADSHR